MECGVRSVSVAQKVFSPDQLDAVTAELRGWKAAHPDVQVLLRADAALRYDDVAPVMAAVAAADMATVHLVAAIPPTQRAGR
jgi:biopolymer transport protein ExbD